MSKIKKFVKALNQLNVDNTNRIHVPVSGQPVQLATSQQTTTMQQSNETEFYSVLIVPERNSVNVFNRNNELLMTSPMDRSAFKDIRESVGLLGPKPHVETVDCKGIAEAILKRFNGWYSEIKEDGTTDEDIVRLLKEMTMYLVTKHPMVVANPVSGPEVICLIFNDVLDRIENS